MSRTRSTDDAIFSAANTGAEFAPEVSDASCNAASERVADNVRTWRLYLPDDCVDTMIKMGWDRTT